MGTEFEREVEAIFAKRAFNREQREIAEAQKAIELKKQQRKKRDRRDYFVLRWADRASATIAGFFAGMAVFGLFYGNPVATMFCALFAAAFVCLSCAFCEFADRKNGR